MLKESDRLVPVHGFELKIEEIFANQKAYKSAVKYLDIPTRKQYIKKFIVNILKHKGELEWALKQDIQMHPVVSGFVELYGILNDLKLLDEQLEQYLQQDQGRKAQTDKTAFTIREPKGNCLIITPWYDPVQLPFLLIGVAVATGNTIMLNLSQYVPYSNKLIKQIIEETFAPEWVVAIEGNRKIVEKLLTLDYDLVHFTGTRHKGLTIQQKVATLSTPVALELRGRNAIFADRAADYSVMARKIIAAKFFKAGQTAFAPDIIFVPSEEMSALGNALKLALEQLQQDSYMYQQDFMKIANHKRFDKLFAMYNDALEQGAREICSGAVDRRNLYLDPIILTGVHTGMLLLQEEVFGPLLPVMGYDKIEDALHVAGDISCLTNLCIFSERQDFVDHIIHDTRSRKVFINETPACGMAHMKNGEGPEVLSYSAYKIQNEIGLFTTKRDILTSSGGYNAQVPGGAADMQHILDKLSGMFGA